MKKTLTLWIGIFFLLAAGAAPDFVPAARSLAHRLPTFPGKALPRR